jgi:hypothetical protein
VSLEQDLRKAERKAARNLKLKQADFSYTPSAMSKQVEKAQEAVEVEALMPTPE